ncbi:alpha/beta-hydrolase [Choiromyces venosus 120613-1]|uniref:Carboxylic ester hydrolase n=1 Tax=Choiromyces venosus 120613-1 TaxID=1336337 RepID=A0A3N4JC48_9PEZI|nr:alpha/beta-hydrolase [Choiromyces venosus 120613-1]
MRVLSSIVLLPALVAAAAINATLPIIDLGYAIHRAMRYNATFDTYTFSNIRFAAAPIGKLRFAPPTSPPRNRATIQDGSVGAACPQAPLAPNGTIGVSEDCLFLDVIVPRSVIEGKARNVPVLFWIFGGGYIVGAKDAQGEPRLVLKESPEPVIYVAPNYRLGALGFSAGPSFTLSENTVPNAGIYDQMFALEWVQKYIPLFGGDKEQVTVMGISAGGGSIMHLISAYGGRGSVNFKRAIPLSPGFYPMMAHASSEKIYKLFESLAGCTCSDIECLRAAPSSTIQQANSALFATNLSASSGVGPVLDGNLVPDIPAYLFLRGLFHKEVEIMVSDDFEEGSLFTNRSETNFEDAIRSTFPSITPDAVAKIVSFYPASSYNSTFWRLAAVTSDIIFNCNNFAMASSESPKKRYRFLTSIPPGTHAVGAAALFGAPLGDPAVVRRFRRFVMNFVVYGDPNGSDGGVGNGVVFPEYNAGKGLEVSGTEIKQVDLGGDTGKCTWWSQGFYTP